MTPFDTFAVVDWSAGNDTGPRPRKDAIWAAVADREKPVYLRNRTLALEWLSELIGKELATGRRLMIGFDFPFGYPKGFASAVVGQPSPLRLWDFFQRSLQDTPRANNRFALAGELNGRLAGIGPFWFNGTKTDIASLPRLKSGRTSDHGLPERRQCEERAAGTFTCWQMGGAGAVGGQVMTGLAALSRLRSAFGRSIAVWPFEELSPQVAFVEVWPSLIADVVRASGDPIKDRAQVRLLADAISRLDESELRAMLDVDEPEEGWILGLGFERELRHAACRT